MSKKCPDGKVLNPNSGRCVEVGGATHKRLVKEGVLSGGGKERSVSRTKEETKVKSKDKVDKSLTKECPEGKVLNPSTNRCVKEGGAVHKKLLKDSSGSGKTAPRNKSRKTSRNKSRKSSSPKGSRASRSVSRLPIRISRNKLRKKSSSKVVEDEKTEHPSELRVSPRSSPSRSSPQKKSKNKETVVPIVVEDDSELGCVGRSKLPLKEHQKLLVNYLRTQRGILAIHAVGSGKTLTAVTASQCFLEDNPKGKIIVVTPTSLQENFKKEMKQYNPKINFIKYSFYTLESFSRASSKGEVSCKNTMLIVDEAHNIRTEVKTGEKGGKVKGARAIALLRCASFNNASKVLLLTATPIVNEAYDLVNLMSLIKGEDPISKKYFKSIIEDQEAFRGYFGCLVSVFEPDISETAEFYPRSKTHEVFIPMPAEYERRYLNVESDNNQDLFSNPSMFYNGVRRASNKLDDSIDSPKILWLKEFLDGHDNGKIVIFSHWLDAGLNSVKQVLEKRGIPYLHIDGSLNQKKRAEAVKEYNENKIRVLLISKAGGEGLDLKETRFMVLMDPGWNPAVSEQVIGRGIRFKSHYHLPKKEQKVDVYKLFLVKSREAGRIDRYEDVNKAIVSENKWSVDMYLRALAKYKKVLIDGLIDRLKTVSIESGNC
jgi:SNF2 family DNA or RNA helicase